MEAPGEPTTKMLRDGPDRRPPVSEEDDLTIQLLPEIEGVLSKWTNYFGGWQERLCALKDGFLSYYLTETEMGDSCRGFMNLKDAHISAHEYDELRFDVTVGGNIFYLRALTKEDAELWLDALEQTKQILSENGPGGLLGSETSSLHKRSSSSLASVASLKVTRTLRDKFTEAEARRDLMLKHVEKIKEVVATLSNTLAPAILEELSNATSAAEAEAKSLCVAMEECVEVMSTHEEEWGLKVAREREGRKLLEQKLQAMKVRSKQQAEGQQTSKFGAGPDIEEGPHMLLAENEFYDALETSLDAHDQLEQALEREKESLEAVRDGGMSGGGGTLTAGGEGKEGSGAKKAGKLGPGGIYAKEIDQKVKNAMECFAITEAKDGWEKVDGPPNAKLFRKDVEAGSDQISDHTRATVTVQGVTAREISWYFWSLETRREWEAILETYRLVNDLGSNTIVVNQLYTRIWPAAQRDVTFLSALRHLDDDTSVVVNFSIKDPKDPVPPNLVRAECNISLRCITKYKDSADGKPRDQITRDDIYTELLYNAEVSPGGWVPPAVVRTTAKREYPKFAHRLGKCCREYIHKNNKPLEMS
eukprot:comp6187_c0_seq1/m.2022 comp6187_c0_seq1/g.2022  ORF comp6187_c0_seq1/g.2022 comp6187_c0_seq1/m.2022 type:complete len:589 (-) comp6187_c0_seq1:155-1921(-)